MLEVLKKLEYLIIEKLNEGYYDFEVKFRDRYVAMVSGNTVEIGSLDDDLKTYPRISRKIENAIDDFFQDNLKSPPFTSFTL